MASRNFFGLLLISILLGLATAAGIVLVMAVHGRTKVLAATANQSARSHRPSPFGTGAAPVPPPESGVTPAAIEKAGNPAVVMVTGYDANDQPVSRANGYVYSASGIVVTSYSAIRGASSVTVDTSQGDELTVIALMGYSPARDLAALAVLEGNLPTLPNGADESVGEGDPVTVLGFNRVVSQGVIGPRRATAGVDLLAVNAQAGPGSPVVNHHSKVVGLTIGRAPGLFAIPTHYVSDLLAERRTMSFEQMLEETRR